MHKQANKTLRKTGVKLTKMCHVDITGRYRYCQGTLGQNFEQNCPRFCLHNVRDAKILLLFAKTLLLFHQPLSHSPVPLPPFTLVWHLNGVVTTADDS
jgi:hypothetical protein